MQGCYIQYGSSALQHKSGVAQKIIAQINAFNDANLNCKEHILSVKTGIINSIKWRLPFFNVAPIWEYDDIFNTMDYIYMRRPMIMTKYMYDVLEKIRIINPMVKILIEIPTYPYDKELDHIKLCGIAKQIDVKNRMRMKNVVDRFVTLSDDDEIFGLPTIKIVNGVDLSKIKMKKYIIESDESIRICAVANFDYWHGYERLLKGLSDYYINGGNRNIICEFAGDGPALHEYKRMVNDLNLKEHVVFWGYLNGDELLQLYDRASIALGEFGGYKKNLYYSDSLKSREALARGIPLVTGVKTNGFALDKCKYFYEFSNDSSILDINRIIEFHDQIYSEETGEEVIKNIRAYAEKTVDIRSCMQPVIDYLQM